MARKIKKLSTLETLWDGVEAIKPLDLAKLTEEVQTLVRAHSAEPPHSFSEDTVVSDLVRAINRLHMTRTPRRPYSSLATKRVRNNIIALRNALEKARLAAWAVNNDAGPVTMLVDGELVETANDAQRALRWQVRTLLHDDVFHQIGPGLTETLGAMTSTVERFISETVFSETPRARAIGANAPAVIHFIQSVASCYESCTGKKFAASDGGDRDSEREFGQKFVQACWVLAGQDRNELKAHKMLSALNKTTNLN